MAKALVEVVGDSASAVRALEETSAAFTATGDAADKAAVGVDAFAASMAKAQATRAETLLAQAGSLRSYAAGSDATALEASAARTKAAQNETRAQKLLGIQTAQTASVTETAGKIGRGLTTYVTAPAAFIGYEAVKQAIDFNQQMLLLKTQAGDATDSIKTLSNEVLKLSSSGAPQGPVQLSEGLFHLVSLGLRGAQAMGTLREASLAAGMGMANLEDTSTALGAAVVSGIKGAQNYQQAMATLVGTAGAGNMRFQDLASSIGNVIPSAAAAGITLHEMGAALAVLTDRGMTAEEASTRLRMSLALIQRPSLAAQKALADMGVNADSLGAMIRQPNGLLKVLEVLRTAMDKVGTVRGNRDLLEAFGGARSGIGIQTLVQSLDSSVSSYQGKLAQINQDQAQFAQNQQAYLQSPAYKLHTALAQVEADLVKLGTALTPAVTGVADSISTIANGFSALPGPIKESVGVIVGLLAVGGPIALAVSGIGKLVEGIGAMFGRLLPEATPALEGIGAEADVASGQLTLLSAAETKVGTSALAAGAEARAGFLSMLGPIGAAVAAVYGLDKAIKAVTGTDLLARDWGTAGFGADNANDAIRKRGSRNPYPQGTSAYFEWQLGYEGKPSENTQGRRVSPDDAYKAGLKARQDRGTHSGGAGVPGIQNAYTSGSNSTSFTLPPQVQAEFEKAKAGVGNVAHEYAQVRAYIEREIKSGGLSGTALADAYKLLASTQNAAIASVHKGQTAFDQNVHNDTLLGQARVDLAQGEYAAAQQLLKQDQARLQSMLGEARTSEERSAVLRQLAEVERLRHTKRDAFQLSPELQAKIAQIDAEAVLNPTGLLQQQVAAAKEAKAQALRAIHSHTLTMQGLTQAWSIVEQENQVILSALGMAHSYHAVSSRAIVDSVKGLTEAQQMQLRERIAQSEAHRGYAPNSPQAHHHYHHVTVHVESNDSHIVKVVKKHDRHSHQRSGSRR